MKAVVWHGQRDVRVETVPDPTIEEPTDAIVRITSTGLCGSDLHLYEVLAPFMTEGDILGHEPMGIVEAVGRAVRRPRAGRPGRRAVQHLLRPLLHVRPGSSRSARRRRSASTARAPRCSATPSCTARSPAARRSSCGCPTPHYGPIKVPEGPPDDRFVFLSDVLPDGVAGRRVRRRPRRRHASPCSGSGRSARWRAASPATAAPSRSSASTSSRSASSGRASRRRRASTCDATTTTRRRGPRAAPPVAGPTPSSTPSAWRPTARRAPRSAQTLDGAAARRARREADAAAPASTASPPCTWRSTLVRRGGTISLIGVYGGMIDPMPMMTMFDKQIQLRMGQANVRRWVDDLLPLLDRRRRSARRRRLRHPPPAARRAPPTPTRCSRRSRTAPSRSSSSRAPADRVDHGRSTFSAGRLTRTPG